MGNGNRRAVFLDRDGTIIEDVGYPRDPAGVRLLPGAAGALRQLAEQGFLLILVSNQSGVGRGMITPAEAAAVARRLTECLHQQGVRLDAEYYCFHAPWEECRCRKPAAGMLLQAAAEHGVDLARSFLVGDKVSDAEAGKEAGCRTVFLAWGGQTAAGAADCIAGSWKEAVAWVLEVASPPGPE